MIPGDRLLCVLVRPLEQGAEFKDWPLHITIVPWFRTDTSTETLAGELRQALQEQKPFLITVDGEAHFGRRRKPVNLIMLPSPLTDLETAARQLLRSHDAWMVDETTKVKRPFRPHITAQKSVQPREGDRIMCDNLYIIEQKGDHKEVVVCIQL